MPNRFAVYNRQCARVRKTDGAYITVRTDLVRIVLARTKHLGFSPEFGMHFKTNGGAVGHYVTRVRRKVRTSNSHIPRKCSKTYDP